MDTRKEMGEIAFELYKYRERAKKQFELPVNYTLLEIIENKETGFEACSCKNDKGTVVIAYKGTDKMSYKDWMNNKNLLYDEPPEQYKDAYNFYKKTVTKNAPCKIILTGHSLGGILAQLVAANTKEKAITFSTPGIANLLPNFGDRDLKNPEEYKNITNYIANKDILNVYTELREIDFLGSCYIVISDKKTIEEIHNDSKALETGAAIPYEVWLKKRNQNAEAYMKEAKKTIDKFNKIRSSIAHIKQIYSSFEIFLLNRMIYDTLEKYRIFDNRNLYGYIKSEADENFEEEKYQPYKDELKYIEEDYNKPVRLEDMDEEERNDFLEANPNLRIKPVEYQKLDGDNIRDVTYKVLSPEKFRDYINVLTVYNEYKAGEKRVSYGRDEAGLPRLIAAKKDLEGNFTSYMLDIGRITIEDCPMTEERFNEISRYIADELKEALGNYSFRRKRA